MAKKILTYAQMQARFNEYFRKKFVTQQDGADYYGVSKQYISQIILGVQRPSDAMLKDIGVTKTTVFILEK
jgi:DNA-binding XRE family transcriptional regulator